MANYNKVFSDTSIRIGEVRFSYANVFAPRKNEDGTDGKYSVQLLIPKENKQAAELIMRAVAAAKEKGKAEKWGNKIPARLGTPLRDGDEEHPEDENYAGMWFMNASSVQRPKVSVKTENVISEALDSDDFYSGAWGAAVINFYPYCVSGNNGVAAGLNLVLKTRDDKSLGGGGMSAETAFSDLAEGSWLD